MAKITKKINYKKLLDLCDREIMEWSKFKALVLRKCKPLKK